MQNKINFAKTGVMVQCVCPNFVNTNLIRSDFSFCMSWIKWSWWFKFKSKCYQKNLIRTQASICCPHPADLCREGIPDAEKAKEKIKKKFGICTPDDVAKV